MSPRPTPEEAHVDVTVEDDVAVGDPPTRSRTLSSVLHGLRELPKDPDSPRPRANTASRPRAATRLSVDDDDDDEDEDDDNFDVDKGPRWLEAFIEGVKWARSLVLWVFVVVCFGLALLSVPYDGGQSHRRQGRGGVLRWREALICARRLGAGAAVGRGLSGSVRFLGLLIADFSPQFGHFNEAFEWLALEVLMASLGVAVTGMIRDPRDKGQASAVGHLRLPRPLERRLRLALVNAVVAAFGYAFQEFVAARILRRWTAAKFAERVRRADAARRLVRAIVAVAAREAAKQVLEKNAVEKQAASDRAAAMDRAAAAHQISSSLSKLHRIAAARLAKPAQRPQSARQQPWAEEDEAAATAIAGLVRRRPLLQRRPSPPPLQPPRADSAAPLTAPPLTAPYVHPPEALSAPWTTPCPPEAPLSAHPPAAPPPPAAVLPIFLETQSLHRASPEASPPLAHLFQGEVVAAALTFEAFQDAAESLRVPLSLGSNFGYVRSSEQCRIVAKRLFRLLRAASRRLAPQTPVNAAVCARAKPPSYAPPGKKVHFCKRFRVSALIFGPGAALAEADEAGEQRHLELEVFGELFPSALSEIRENDFESGFARTFAERTFLAATIASFSDVNAIVKRIAEAIWALVSLFVTLMLWESSWDAIIGPASILLGVSFAFGSSCAQVVAGVSYVLFTAPYDIGDRVLIKEIREVDFPSPPLTIQAIGPMMTTFVTSFGETITVANHLLATKAMINHTRSPTPFLRVTVSVATRTDPEEVTKLRHALERYVLDNRGDWHVAYLFFSAMNHEKGEMVLDAWMGAANSYHDWDAVYGARSRAYVWLHQYIFKNGLHFVKPTQPFAGADAMPKKLARDDDDRQDHPRDDNAALARRLADLEARLGGAPPSGAPPSGAPLGGARGDEYAAASPPATPDRRSSPDADAQPRGAPATPLRL